MAGNPERGAGKVAHVRLLSSTDNCHFLKKVTPTPPFQLSEKKRKKQIKAEVESLVGECKSLAPFDFLIYTNNRDSAFNEAFNSPKYPMDLIVQQSSSFFKNVSSVQKLSWIDNVDGYEG